MATRYSSQTFEVYEHPVWPIDSRPAYSDTDASSVLDEKVLDPTTPAELSTSSDGRSLSHVKSEEEYSMTDSMWHTRPHGLMASQMRHNSHPSVPLINTNQPYMQSYAATYPQTWPLSADSGTSTPTPIYQQMPYGFGPSPTMPYQGGPVTFPHVQHPHDPTSATSMSPQSSQGGWASGTSSDTTEPRNRTARSPSYRPHSPMSIMRPDGIRKKNARFEIPKERNLQNIDSMILASKDEAEKKELKQQKRLLRNRQAALDSRQRKKTHTEKLELEKKNFTQQKQELEDALENAHQNYLADRELWNRRQQQYDHYIQNLEYERDEAIRTKTLETAELRRMNNVLKDHIRELERQNPARHYSNHVDVNMGAGAENNFGPDFSSFDNLGIEDVDSWDDEFSLINHPDDLKTEDNHGSPGEPMPQQALTPRPPVAQSNSTSTAMIKAVDSSSKSDSSFWNTFYMCLLFGAFVATNSTSTTNPSTASSSTTTTPARLANPIPSLSEDYRAEAGNVLKAVLASGPNSLLTIHQDLAPPISSLDTLHTTLTTPSSTQSVQQAFTLSAASYNHMTNPDPATYLDHDMADLDDSTHIKPTRLASAFAQLQSQREASGVERILRGGNGNGIGNVQERSLLWERVPEKVLRDFHEMVRSVQGEI
jgi:bZIP transcription factor